jgi:hypothetical protein
VIVSADEAGETVTLRHFGQDLTLAMHAARTVPAATMLVSDIPAPDAPRTGLISRMISPALLAGLTPEARAELLKSDQAEEARLRDLKERRRRQFGFQGPQ